MVQPLHGLFCSDTDLMKALDVRRRDTQSVGEHVREFYEAYPYPLPIDNLDRCRQRWQDAQKRRSEHHLVWPARPFAENQSILVAGCGTQFIKAAHDAGEPFFVWFNTSHMHAWTHVKPSSRGQSGRWQSEYHDVMIDHDKCIGEMLDFLDKLGIADNTFVQYGTRQRAAHEYMARCGHDPLPEREELELGRRVSHSSCGPLSRKD
jgi:hypothetical protein